MFRQFSLLSSLAVLLSLTASTAAPASDIRLPAPDAATGFQDFRSFEEQCYSGNGSKCYALGHLAYEENKYRSARDYFEKPALRKTARGAGSWEFFIPKDGKA